MNTPPPPTTCPEIDISSAPNDPDALATSVQIPSLPESSFASSTKNFVAERWL